MNIVGTPHDASASHPIRVRRSSMAALLAVLALALAVSMAGLAEAQVTRGWTGAASGAWNNPNNWQTQLAPFSPGVPQAGDTAVITAGANSCTLPLPGSNGGNDFQVAALIVQTGTLFGGLGANGGRVRITGNFQIFSTYTAQDGHLVFNGTAAQSITSSSQRMGNITIANTSTQGVTFLGSWGIGDPAFTQTITLNPGARLSFGAAANFTNTNVVNNGTLRFAATGAQTITSRVGLNLGNVELVAQAPAPSGIGININNPVAFGSITMSGPGGVQFTNATTVSGSITDNLAGNFLFPTVNSTLTFNGTTPQTVTLAPPNTGNIRLSVQQFIVNADANVTINGLFQSRAKGSLNPAVLVDRPGTAPGSQGGRLTMGLDTVIRVNEPGGESVVRIDGRLTSTAGPGGSRPCFVGGDSPAERARVIFGQTSFVDLNGFQFVQVGNNTSAYGIVISDGATVVTFDNVSVTQSNAVTAIIDLNTGNLPTKESFDFLELEAAPGGAPRNIDANNVSGFVLQLTSGPNSGGNRYGIAFEIDTNQVLAWDSAPAVNITNGSPLNPPAVGDRNYQFNVIATGGNSPYTFSTSAPANPPLILVTQVQAPTVPAPIPVMYLNALTGAVSTDPLFRAVNPTGFPGDPGYDAGQEPVIMPLANVGGVYEVSVTITDSSNPPRTLSRQLQFSVQPPPQPVPQINTFALPDGFEGVAYPTGVVISAVNSTPSIQYPGGNPGFTYSISPGSPDVLPTGLVLQNLTGTIIGTPQFGAANGLPSELYEIDFMVTDILGATDIQRIDIRIFEGVPPLQLASGPPSNAVEGLPYSFKLNALGGKTPYSWDLAPGSGPLPEGLFLSGNGQISGTPANFTSTPTPPGIYPLIFRVTDNLGSQLVQAATIIVNAPPPPTLTLTPSRAGGGGCAMGHGDSAGWAILALGGMVLASAAVAHRRRKHALARAKHSN